MDNLQANSEQRFKSKIVTLTHFLNLILIVLNFTFNFIGHPALKYIYLLHVCLILFASFTFEIHDSMPEIFTLFFLEGQGRIIWGYAGWARIIFDLTTGLALLKIFIRNKKLIDLNKVPRPLMILFGLHILWYIIELFNLNGLSIFAAIAASKIYIFPMLFFLGMVQSNFSVLDKKFKTSLFFFFLLLILEMSLNFYQVTLKQNHLLAISPHYYKAMKDGIFTDTLFRPFATTQLPGALAAFLFLTAGFVHFFKDNLKNIIFKITIIAASLFNIMLCQVRSAIVKYLLIVLFIQIGKMIFDRFRPRTMVPFLVVALFLIFGVNQFLNDTDSSGDENIDYAKSRISTLTEVKKVQKERINLEDFYIIMSNKIMQYPIGFGPGMTGAAASLNADELKESKFITRDMIWTSDNLLISLIIDFGIGAVFYISLVLYVPFYFVRYLFYFYKKNQEQNFRILSVVASSMIVILIGNWGALGLTYNPESFIFWFLAALGLNIINLSKKEEENV